MKPKLSLICSFLLVFATFATLSCGGESNPSMVIYRQDPSIDVTNDVTIKTSDNMAAATFAKDLFNDGAEVRLTNALEDVSSIGVPNGRLIIAAVELALIEPGEPPAEEPPPDGGGDGTGAGGGDGSGGTDGGAGTGGETPAEADAIGGNVALSLTLESGIGWPGGAVVKLYRWSSGIMLWEDTGLTATLDADGKLASATITRFGRYAIMSPLAAEIPPPTAPSLKLISASKTAVLLSWSDPGYSVLAGYNLYYSPDGGDYSKINSEPITETEYRHSPVEPGIYNYRLTLTNTGALEGNPGPAIQVEVTGTDFYTVFGNYGASDKPLVEVRDLAIMPLTHELLVVDSGLCRLAVYSPTGKFRRFVGSRGTGELQFDSPTGVGVSPDGRLIYVADTGNDRVVILNDSLEFEQDFGGRGAGAGFLISPIDVAVRSDGVVFVTDAGNGRIEYYTPHGTYLGQFGTIGQPDEVLSVPTFIVITETDSFYVTDSGDARIVEFSSKLAFDGVVAFSDMGDVPPLESPAGIALDTDGRLYVADYGRNRILVVNSSGKYEYLFGSYGYDWGEFGDGSPIGVAFDTVTGFFFAADLTSGRIQMFQP